MTGETYYEKSLKAEVYPHLWLALDVLNDSAPKVAVDVGAGTGRDAAFLLEQGFTVHAYDKSDIAISRLNEAEHSHLGKRLFTYVCSFERFEYPKSSLISACSSLFFCSPAYFPAAWSNIAHSLSEGGVFCGHFMGPNDSWTKMGRNDLTVHTYDEIEALFKKGFRIVDVREYDEPGQTLLGTPKHWHTYSIVAQKTNADR